MSSTLDELVKLPDAEFSEIMSSLSDAEALALLYDWEFWARPEQLPPQGDWNTWVYCAGRGSGKTRAGAEWVVAKAYANKKARIALVAPTAADARDTMIEGESGIMNIAPPDFKPLYEPSKRKLTFPNGAIAKTYSAEEPERLRGPQHSDAWCDELAAWQYLEDTWTMMRFGLRLPPKPQCLVTTTPKPTQRLMKMQKQWREGDQSIVFTTGSTYANRANLAPEYFDDIINEYEGTRLGRQEIHGEILTDVPGALWSIDRIDSLRVWLNGESIENWAKKNLARIIVAIDPAVTATEESDEVGILVGGKGHDGHYYTIEDLSGIYTPNQWAYFAVSAYHRFDADAIVGEVNNGGDLIESNIRQQDQRVKFIKVRATRGKHVRAEPVASLMEQGIDHHVCVVHREPGRFGEYRTRDRAGSYVHQLKKNNFYKLEDQMIGMTVNGYVGEGSPDRLDAKVWLYTELIGRKDFKRMNIHNVV